MRCSGDEAFLENTALPLAEAVPTYYDEHFPRRGGKLCLTPAQVIEQWWEAQNPMPEIAGMRACLSALLDWPEDRCPRRDDWRRLLAELPSMPVGESDGKLVFLLEAFQPRFPFKASTLPSQKA